MRQHLAALLWIAGTTAAVAGAQIVTTRAAAERRAVTRLNIKLVENTVHIRELEAELRTRAGLPQLQRWNDSVFQMSAPQGSQILRSPVELAAFAATTQAAPKLQFAVDRGGMPDGATAPKPEAGHNAGPQVVKASFAAEGNPLAAPAADEPLPGDDMPDPHGGGN